MSIFWKRCFLCKGDGKLSILRSRINIFKFKTEPIIEDKDDKCPLCKGRGNIPVNNNPLYKENLGDDDEQRWQE